MSVKYFDKEKKEWIIFPGLGGGSTSGGDIDFSEISASIGDVVETDKAMASVDFEDKNFEFSFGFPKGIKGDKGDKGDRGESGVSVRTVLAFTTSDDKPNKPVGGSWDILSNEVTLPDGWSMTDEIAKPVWMSSGIFYNERPNEPVWSEPSLISGADGTNGTDGVSVEFIYKLTADHTDIYKPSTPTEKTQTDVAPEGWTDSPSGISEEMQCEWASTRKWIDNGWSDWCEPFIWSKWGSNGLDGDGVQYIYYLNDGEPVDNPTISDYATNDAYQESGAYNGIEYCPASPWTDEPSGVTPDNKCEWVSVRKFRDGKWGPYSDPKLWARYGESGISGLISRSKYAITDSSAVIPEFNKMEKNPGSIWYSTLESAMMHYEYPQAMWTITAYFDRNNEFASVTDDDGNTVIGWQGPIIISGTKGDQGPIGPQGIQGEAGATGPEGPNGPIGVAGVGMEFRYCRGTADAPEYTSVDDITYGSDSIDGGKATPNGWSWNTENMILEGDYLYVWCIQGKKKYNDDKDSYSIDWQAAFRLSGLNGSEKGDQGEAGPVVYPAGYWNENQTYEIKNGLCPYVYYEGNFYILNATPSTGHNPEEYPKIWVKMESFEAIYADVGVFKQALVGSAVFHGDYVYSQQGIDNTDYTKAEIDTTDGTLKNFIPNVKFNFGTGEGHLAGGNISWDQDGNVTFGSGVKISWNSVKDKTDLENNLNKAMQDAANADANANAALDAVDGKADKSDIPDVSKFITGAEVQDMIDKIDNIDVEISASDVVDAINGGATGSNVLAEVVNGQVKINGTAITDGAIATKHIVANGISGTAITAGTITGNQIATDAIEAKHIKAGSITIGKVDGLETALNGKASSSDLQTITNNLQNSINSKADSSVVGSLQNSINEKATLTDMISALQNAPNGQTKIDGGWIKTNAINIIPSQVTGLDDKITTITNETISSSTVLAEKIKSTTISADKIIGGELDFNKVKALNLTVTGGITVGEVEDLIEDATGDFLTASDLGKNGKTTIYGGRIDTNTLNVNAANVTGELTSATIRADKISGGTISADCLNVDTIIPKQVANDNAVINSSGVLISVGGVTFEVNSSGIYVKDETVNGKMKLYEYVIHQYKQDNFTINEESTEYKYELESSGHGIDVSLVSGTSNSISIPANEYVDFSLNATKRTCTTPVTYTNGNPSRGSKSCGSWASTYDRIWSVSYSGGVTATINGDILTIKRTSSGSVKLSNGTGDILTLNVS